MSVTFFDYADLPVSRWRNGGGETREIACWPWGGTILVGVSVSRLSNKMGHFRPSRVSIAQLHCWAARVSDFTALIESIITCLNLIDPFHSLGMYRWRLGYWAVAVRILM